MDVLYYTPPDELGPVAVGDKVQTMDRDMRVMEEQTIVHVGKRHCRTDCGRKWTLDDGSWVAEFRGGKPVSYPFPSIRRPRNPE